MTAPAPTLTDRDKQIVAALPVPTPEQARTIALLLMANQREQDRAAS